MTVRSTGLILLCLAMGLAAARAQSTDVDAFKDASDEGKLHVASGFICPQFIGHFERDAFGERDPERGSDFCAYSGRDGVYGTVTLTPLTGPYDAKAELAPEFAEQEGIGGKIVGETTLSLPTGKSGIPVYTRTYETAALETLHYRIQFAVGTIGNWALETTMEFATPRDDAAVKDFLDVVYAEALAHVAKLPPSSPAKPPVSH